MWSLSLWVEASTIRSVCRMIQISELNSFDLMMWKHWKSSSRSKMLRIYRCRNRQFGSCSQKCHRSCIQYKNLDTFDEKWSRHIVAIVYMFVITSSRKVLQSNRPQILKKNPVSLHLRLKRLLLSFTVNHLYPLIRSAWSQAPLRCPFCSSVCLMFCWSEFV